MAGDPAEPRDDSDQSVDATSLLESTANMLRGMTMDPAIPEHAKEAMRRRIATIDQFTADDDEEAGDLAAELRAGAEIFGDGADEITARVCHEVNRAYCEAIGDLSQKPWDEAEQWQRDSAIKGVKFALANPHATPADQHESWMADKIADGWMYGEKKDADAKTHPALLPYDQLPQEQRIKDYLFRAVVRTLG